MQRKHIHTSRQQQQQQQQQQQTTGIFDRGFQHQRQQRQQHNHDLTKKHVSSICGSHAIIIMYLKVSLRKVIMVVGFFCLALQTKNPTKLLDSSAFFSDPLLNNKSRQQNIRVHGGDSLITERIEHNNTQVSQSSASGFYYFPAFIEKYVAFHNQQRLHPNAKYLIWRCPRGTLCGGTGDRIKGIVTAFYTALCTDRVLLIDWPVSETPNVTPFLSPHRIDWTIPPNVQKQLYIQRVPLYSAIDNYNNPWFKNLTIPTSFQNHPVIDMRSNLWSEHVKAVVRVNDTQCIQQQWQHEPLLVYTTTSTTHNNPPHYMQDKYLFRMGFWTMFTFSKAIHDRKRAMQKRAGLLLPDAVAIPPQNNEQRAAQALLSENNNQQFEQNLPTLSIAGEDTTMRPYIAVHIRTGIGSSWNDPLRHGSQEDYKQFYQCAKRLQLGIYQRQRQAASTCGSSGSTRGSTNFDYDYQRPLPLLPIYIAADNIVAKQAMVKLEEEAGAQQQQQQQQQQQASPTNLTNRTIRVIEDMQIYHIDRSQKQGNDAELTVWAELNVLLESTCLVASRSGFSDLATWLQPATARRCAVMFNQCEDESKVQTALDALDFSCPKRNRNEEKSLKGESWRNI